MVASLKQVMEDVGVDTLNKAVAVANVVAPVAAAIGAMIEPVEKLLRNPFTSMKQGDMYGSQMGMGYALRLKRMAYALQEGIKVMATTLISALASVPASGVDISGLTAVFQAISLLIDTTDEAMSMSKLAPKKFDDLAIASQRLMDIVGALRLPNVDVSGLDALTAAISRLVAAVVQVNEMAALDLTKFTGLAEAARILAAIGQLFGGGGAGGDTEIALAGRALAGAGMGAVPGGEFVPGKPGSEAPGPVPGALPSGITVIHNTVKVELGGKPLATLVAAAAAETAQQFTDDPVGSA